MPSWEQLAAEFVGDHDPSSIVATMFLGGVPFGDDGVQDDKRQVFLPIGDVRAKKQWCALLNYVEDPRCLVHPGLDGVPLIYDSSASVCIPPTKHDFISYCKSNAKVKDLSKSNAVAGEGMIRWSVYDVDGKPCILSFLATTLLLQRFVC